MTHQAVKVVGTGSAGVNLVVCDFGLLAQILPQGLRDEVDRLEQRLKAAKR